VRILEILFHQDREVTGSISAQGLVEIGDRIVKSDHALRALYYTGEHREIPAINYTLLHGVRAALALSRTSCRGECAGLDLTSIHGV
jgi:hypothetical protein